MVISMASTAIQIAIQVGIKCALVLSKVLILLKLFVILGGYWSFQEFKPHVWVLLLVVQLLI